MNFANRSRFLNLRSYTGQDIELIIGIDVGTMFSGVSYAFLRPGEIPKIMSVERFTDQTNGDHKIPSIMYYDEHSNLRAAGATAVSDNVVDEAEFEGWHKAECFKMHMRPSDMKIDTFDLVLRELPPSMTIIEVMADFLRYLYLETIKYIEKHHSDGDTLLETVSNRTRFVLSHPNGWMGLPQQRMREAAVLGGLIEDSEAGRAKIMFVSEGEASALSCLAGGLCPPDLQPGYRFMIADLGGGTLDMTSYELVRSVPLQLKELARSDCRFAGSVFVNTKARALLQQRLRDSKYDNPQILDDAIKDSFESDTKRQFKDATKVSWLLIGQRGENDAKLGIRKGSLRMDGSELEECFEHSVNQAVASIQNQIAECGGRPMPVWIVGGFAASPWLFKKLKENLEGDGIVISHPDIDLAKAVANGNLLYALEHPVISRVTRGTYGINCNTYYQASNPDHRRRSRLKYTNLDDEEMLPGKFDIIVSKNIEVKESQEFVSRYRVHGELGKASFESYACELLTYDRDDSPPEWYDENKDKFRAVCHIKADLSPLCRMSALKTRNGTKYWTLHFEVEIMFGLTEWQARMTWVDDGETKYGPASIFYEE